MPRDATEEQLRQYYNNAAKDYDKVIIFIYLFHIINKCLQHTQLLPTRIYVQGPVFKVGAISVNVLFHLISLYPCCSL